MQSVIKLVVVLSFGKTISLLNTKNVTIQMLSVFSVKIYDGDSHSYFYTVEVRMFSVYPFTLMVYSV